MTFMLEIYDRSPSDSAREATWLLTVQAFGGWLDYREAPETDGSANVCITYEFADLAAAKAAADRLRSLGVHVEGPYEYG